MSALACPRAVSRIRVLIMPERRRELGPSLQEAGGQPRLPSLAFTTQLCAEPGRAPADCVSGKQLQNTTATSYSIKPRVEMLVCSMLLSGPCGVRRGWKGKCVTMKMVVTGKRHSLMPTRSPETRRSWAQGAEETSQGEVRTSSLRHHPGSVTVATAEANNAAKKDFLQSCPSWLSDPEEWPATCRGHPQGRVTHPASGNLF